MGGTSPRSESAMLGKADRAGVDGLTGEEELPLVADAAPGPSAGGEVRRRRRSAKLGQLLSTPRRVGERATPASTVPR